MVLGAKIRRVATKGAVESVEERDAMEAYALYRYTMYTRETHL